MIQAWLNWSFLDDWCFNRFKFYASLRDLRNKTRRHINHILVLWSSTVTNWFSNGQYATRSATHACITPSPRHTRFLKEIDELDENVYILHWTTCGWDTPKWQLDVNKQNPLPSLAPALPLPRCWSSAIWMFPVARFRHPFRLLTGQAAPTLRDTGQLGILTDANHLHGGGGRGGHGLIGARSDRGQLWPIGPRCTEAVRRGEEAGRGVNSRAPTMRLRTTHQTENYLSG